MRTTKSKIFSFIFSIFVICPAHGYEEIGTEKTVKNVISISEKVPACYGVKLAKKDKNASWDAPAGWAIMGHEVRVINARGVNSKEVSTSVGNHVAIAENHINEKYKNLIDLTAQISDEDTKKDLLFKLNNEKSKFLDMRSLYMNSNAKIAANIHVEGSNESAIKVCARGAALDLEIDATIKKMITDEDINKSVDEFYKLINKKI